MYYLDGTKIEIFIPEERENQKLLLRGRIFNVRDMGKMVWLDVIDNGLIYQAYVSSDNLECLNIAKTLTLESVISVVGHLYKKPNPNLKIHYGTHELVIDSFVYYSISEQLPFNPHTDSVSDDLLQQNRFLTLRTEDLHKNIISRYNITKEVRKFLDEESFIEIETPTLVKSTPEGARDFLIPSRLYVGHFYALPQSPQLYKQILIQSGFNKYFQIARCYRDEALRGDRQLEFTQIDLEVAFFTQEEIKNLSINLISHIFKSFNKKLILQREITYKESMFLYGNDKPDLRFELKIHTTDVGLYIKTPRSMTNKERSAIYEWFKIYSETCNFKEKLLIINDNNKSQFPHVHIESETAFYFNDTKTEIRKILGELRNHIGRSYFLNDDCHVCCWINDFPMFEWSAEEDRFVSMHHPFTRPKNVEYFLENPYDSIADAYDLVIDGVEIGGGSVRIHEPELQKKVFDLLGTPVDRFEGLLRAYNYGATPHAGLAFGLDRLCTFFGQSKKINDYIAFPKNMKGVEHMLKCPTTIDKKQLDELKININEERDK